mgnify:FL=1|jgi:hypothetical protein
MLMSVISLVAFLAVICTPGLIAQSRDEARARRLEGDA